jgi:hypothetical protein
MLPRDHVVTGFFLQATDKLYFNEWRNYSETIIIIAVFKKND